MCVFRPIRDHYSECVLFTCTTAPNAVPTGVCHHSSYHLDCYSYSIVESLTTLEWNESTQPLLRTS